MVEPVAIENGYHAALGGSVLHRGASGKDLDVFVYPHKTKDARNLEILRTALRIAGVENWEEKPHAAYGDDKEVWATEYQGKRIDFFFVK